QTVLDHFLRVAGHINNLDSWTLFSNAARCIFAIHSWHYPVGKHQINSASILSSDFNRVPSILCFQYAEASRIQDLSQQFSQGLLIFDQKNGGAKISHHFRASSVLSLELVRQLHSIAF